MIIRQKYVGVFILCALLFSGIASAEETVQQKSAAQLDCPMCKKSVAIPFVRIAIVETVLYVGSASIWPDAYAPTRVRQNFHQFKESWSSPPAYNFDPNFLGSDGDWWYFNLAAHGLFGSEIYLAARGWGHRPVIAGLYGVFASVFWEYFIESWAKQPSAVDLFWTPAFGALFGELRYQGLRAAGRIRTGWLSLSLRILVDPLGELERAVMDCRLDSPSR
jgi:hypothetical protein